MPVLCLYFFSFQFYNSQNETDVGIIERPQISYIIRPHTHTYTKDKDKKSKFMKLIVKSGSIWIIKSTVDPMHFVT